MEDYHLQSESILSSSYNGQYQASRGRLFNSVTWNPAHTDQNAFLQIGNGKYEYLITAVATQGHSTMRSAVVKFQLSFSNDGLHWFYYREDGEVRVKTFNFFYV